MSLKTFTPLSQSFYKIDTVEGAKKLLGKILIKKCGNVWVGGYIVETEAYLGEDDPASHASYRKTPRNTPMFGPVGFAYVYFIYGMYYCFNAVCYDPSFQRAGAILIRAIEPAWGIDIMKKRRKKEKIKELTNGPSKLCNALGITKDDNQKPLWEGNLIIAEGNIKGEISKSKRIGIKNGKDLPLRFYIKNNPYVSK